MIKVIFIGILLMIAGNAFCQQFEILNNGAQGLTNGKIITSDLNADSLLELLISGKDNLGQAVTRIYTIKADGALILENDELPGFEDPELVLSDLNNDGYNDILISGKIDSIPSFLGFRNDLNFAFSPYYSWPGVMGSVRSADLNNDGRMDVLLSGEDEKNEDVDFMWLRENLAFITKDSSGFHSSGEYEILDYNGDNYLDVITTKSESEDILSLELLKNDGKGGLSKVEQSFVDYVNPVFAKGDLLSNGEMDLVVGGELGGENFIDIYSNQSAIFSLNVHIPVDAEIRDLIAVDITNDGLMDIIVLTSNYVSLIQVYSDSFEKTILLDSIAGGSIAIGDFDRDYDQDLFITGERDGSSGIWLFKNSHPLNESPSISHVDSVMLTTEGFFLKWEPSTDDNTKSQSLSYKIIIWKEDILFNATNWTLSEYSSMELGTDYTFHNFPSGTYNINLKTIDNSLITAFNYPDSSTNVIGGMCEGTGSGFCTNYVISPEIRVCKDDLLTFESPTMDSVEWHSLNEGLFSKGVSTVFKTHVDDVLYTSYIEEDCQIFWFKRIIVKDTTAFKPVLEDSVQLCEGEILNAEDLYLSTPPDSIPSWSIIESGSNLTSLNFPYQFQNDAKIFLEVPDENGCIYRDTVSLQLFALPDINAGEDTSIVRGSSIQLNATGGISYLWDPPDRLSNDTIPNPICTPVEEMLYTVYGTDVNNCLNQDQVFISIIEEEVEYKLFVPNLFSPNNDKMNDTFKVYGQGLKNLSLKIYSNSGSLLYNSSDLQVIQQQGWDGTSGGRLMPPGTYLWSLTGEFLNGQKVSVDGRNTGLLTLIR